VEGDGVSDDTIYFLTVKQVAERLACSVPEVFRLRKSDPTFPPFCTRKEGGDPVCYLARLKVWMEARMSEAERPAEDGGGLTQAESLAQARALVAKARRAKRRSA
jgi:hypothetical protein